MSKQNKTNDKQENKTKNCGSKNCNSKQKANEKNDD